MVLIYLVKNENIIIDFLFIQCIVLNITLYNISEKNIHNTYDVTLSSSLSDNIVRRKEFKNLHLHNS